MSKVDQEYFRLVEKVLTEGKRKKNRTGIDTISIFGEQAKYNVDLNAFPILTTKKVWFKGIVHELLWFIKGDTNIKYLVDNDVHIWDEWAYKRYRKDCVGNPHFDLRQMASQEQFIDLIKKVEWFAKKWGELGEGTYGSMWRRFPYYEECEILNGPTYSDGLGNITRSKIVNRGTVDQLQKVIDKLKTNPDDRRMIVSAWHPYWVDHCALPPCHCLFHFNTEELTNDERDALATPDQKDIAASIAVEEYDKEGTYFEELTKLGVPTRRLNCLLYQRSCDFPIGIPFNVTSYALLTAMVAHVSNMVAGTFTHTYGDCHIYENQIDGIKEQLKREPMDLPKLWLNPDVKSLFDFKYEDIKLIDYKSHPKIEFQVAV